MNKLIKEKYHLDLSHYRKYYFRHSRGKRFVSGIFTGDESLDETGEIFVILSGSVEVDANNGMILLFKNLSHRIEITGYRDFNSHWDLITRDEFVSAFNNLNKIIYDNI